MKNILIWSRATDRNIGIATSAICALALAALIGFALPAPGPCDAIPLLDGFIAAMLLLFIWGSFHMARPSRYSQGWAVAEVFVIPLVWGLLVAALGFWLHHLKSAWEILPEELLNKIIA